LKEAYGGLSWKIEGSLFLEIPAADGRVRRAAAGIEMNADCYAHSTQTPGINGCFHLFHLLLCDFTTGRATPPVAKT
jgi:hypothetical protein